MKYKVFIDGKDGTTGLRIYDRFKNRDDVELILIDENLKKDLNERKKCINKSDITFLCLPDLAAKEAITLLENKHTRIIDTSTANRCNPDFAYGFPELGEEFYNKIKNNQFIAVPGCYATGFISIAYPLVKLGIIDNDYPLTISAISGYSGAGKKGIAQYEDENRNIEFDSPRLYGLSQMHKHLNEMQYIANLKEKPIFNPYVCDFYEGMTVSVGLYASKLKTKFTPEEISLKLKEFYNNNGLVKVMPFKDTATDSGFIPANMLANKDYLEIFVSGNEDRINITAVLDNLGKGASGAAIECMNIIIGADIKKGLEVGGLDD